MMTQETLRERVARAIWEAGANASTTKWENASHDAKLIVYQKADAALSLMQPEIDRRVAEEKAKLMERLRVLTTEITSGYRRAVKPRVVMGDDDSIYLTDFQDGELHAVKVMEEKLSAMLTAFQQENSDGR